MNKGLSQHLVTNKNKLTKQTSETNIIKQIIETYLKRQTHSPTLFSNFDSLFMS